MCPSAAANKRGFSPSWLRTPRLACSAMPMAAFESRIKPMKSYASEFWKERTGKWPQELIFDSKLTTHANLHRLTQRGIDFITLRRRSFEMLQQVYRVPLSAWRRIELTSVTREYRTPRILDQTITLSG